MSSYAPNDWRGPFSRQQVQQLTDIPDDVLGYWMREKLLVPIDLLGRKHRRFRPEQIFLAAVLNEMRGLGANIGVLRKFATLFNRGLDLVRSFLHSGDLTEDDLFDVVRVGSALIHLRKISSTELPDAQQDLPLGAKSDEMAILRTHLAETEEQVARCFPDLLGDYTCSEASISVAESLSEYDVIAFRTYCDCLSAFHVKDVAWLFWIDQGGDVRLASGFSESFRFEGGDPPPRSAFYIALSECAADIELRRSACAGNSSEASEENAWSVATKFVGQA